MSKTIIQPLMQTSIKFKNTFSFLTSFSFIILNFLVGFMVYTLLKLCIYFTWIVLPKKYFNFAVEFITNVIMLIFLFWVITKKLKVNLAENIYKLKKDLSESALMIITFPVGFIILIFGLYYFNIPVFGFEIFRSDFLKTFVDNVIKNSFFLSGVLLFIDLCVVVPMKEEIIIKRLLYVSLRKKTNFIQSSFISSIFFSIIHGNFLTSFVYSFFSCYIYEKYGRLSINILIHALVNFYLICILILLQINF